MKAWLRDNPDVLPAWLDPTASTSHQLSRALQKLGWQLQQGDSEVRLIQAESVDIATSDTQSGNKGRISERQWIHNLVPDLSEALRAKDTCLEVRDGYRLPYTTEVLRYSDDLPDSHLVMRYETDLMVLERSEGNSNWTPRVVVEAKLGSVTTHDAITYSQKATTQKSVHPYLRYGIFIGRQLSLPRRLFRHGASFDFMICWEELKPSPEQFTRFVNLLIDEVRASRLLQEIMFKSQPKAKLSYTMLQKPLELR